MNASVRFQASSRRLGEVLLLSVEEAVRGAVVDDDLVLHALTCERLLEGRVVGRRDRLVVAGLQRKDADTRCRQHAARRLLHRVRASVTRRSRPSLQARARTQRRPTMRGLRSRSRRRRSMPPLASEALRPLSVHPPGRPRRSSDRPAAGSPSRRRASPPRRCVRSSRTRSQRARARRTRVRAPRRSGKAPAHPGKITTPAAAGPSGTARNAATLLPSAAVRTRSSCETAAPAIREIGGSESRSKHISGI